MSRSPDRGWTEADIPDQGGRRAIVTGSNTGLGRETARMLAARGAKVVIACRNTKKGDEARAYILASAPAADVTVSALDLSDLESVRGFAARELAEGGPLDLLVNNAGVMAVPLARTAQGVEMQMGTNHLGHFVLTALLWPKLSGGGRVVTVSSTMHKTGRVALLDDPAWERRPYSEWQAYGQSKLANLLFTLELDRRIRAAGLTTRALAAHPGYAATELQGRGAQLGGSKLQGWVMDLGNRLFAQSPAAGAWPTMRAATDPDAQSGEYYGPGRMMEMWGPARRVEPTAAARDPEAARTLWAWSEKVGGVRLLD